jgi:hypothetical protein
VEIYFSVIQRKVLTPNDFLDLAELQQRLLGFQRATSRPRPRSTGATPALTSTGSSSGWTTMSTLARRHDHHARTSMRQY